MAQDKYGNLIMPFGKFRGMAVKKIPNGYLRWLITTDAPESIKKIALAKLRNSDYDDTDIDVTRHALDMYSKRFLEKWKNRKIGIASHVAQMSMEALEKGKQVRDERKIGRGIRYYYDDIIWVFDWKHEHPEYRTLITVIKPNKQTQQWINKILKEN